MININYGFVITEEEAFDIIKHPEEQLIIYAIYELKTLSPIGLVKITKKNQTVLLENILENTKEDRIPEDLIDYSSKGAGFLPDKFRDLLILRHIKFEQKYNSRITKFTLGFDNKAKYYAISIVNPKNKFKKELGKRIVEGRILRAKNKLDRTKYIK